MIKLALKTSSVLWILSPWGYIALRFAGIVNHPQDVPIIVTLGLISMLTAFLTFGKDE